MLGTCTQARFWGAIPFRGGGVKPNAVQFEFHQRNSERRSGRHSTDRLPVRALTSGFCGLTAARGPVRPSAGPGRGSGGRRGPDNTAGIHAGWSPSGWRQRFCAQRATLVGAAMRRYHPDLRVRTSPSHCAYTLRAEPAFVSPWWPPTVLSSAATGRRYSQEGADQTRPDQI